MLKHKLRRPSDIINFSRVKGDKKKQKEVIYSKVRKSQGRKISGDFSRSITPPPVNSNEHPAADKTPPQTNQKPGKENKKQNQLSSPHLDGGYFTGPESFYETPDSSRVQEDGQPSSREDSKQQESLPPKANFGTQFDSLYTSINSGPQSLPLAILVPVPVQWIRRSTPAEDFLYTSQCVENLVKQQNSIVKDLSARMESILETQIRDETDRVEETYSVSPVQKMKHQPVRGEEQRSYRLDSTQLRKQSTQQANNSEGGTPSESLSSSSGAGEGMLEPAQLTSIRRLQRIMEIEDMLQFSDSLNRHIKKMST